MSAPFVSEDRPFGEDDGEENEEGGEEGGEGGGGGEYQSFNPDASSRDAVVFLVDCCPQMFVKEEDGLSKFQYAIRLFTNLLKQKIMSDSKNDMFSLVLFSTKAKKNPNNLPGVYVQNKMAAAGSGIIRDAQALSDGPGFKSIGSAEAKEVEFSNVLWAVQTLFADLNKNYSKRVFLFTCRDDPTDGTEAGRAKALSKYKDLEELGIQLELFPTPLKDTNFDIKKFFMHILTVLADEDTGKVQETFNTKFQDLEATVRRRAFNKRSLATLALEIAPGVNVGIKMYCVVRPSTPAPPIQVHSQTSEPLQCVTKWLDAETGAILQDHEIKTYLPYGDQKVFMNRAEMNEIKSFGEPALTLMGFKSMRKLKPYHNIKPPYFVYPDDTQYQNSTVAFSALLNRMLALNKFAVARLIYRKRTPPRFVALVPQKEEKDKEGNQTAYPGFHMIYLPFADDIRTIKLDPTPIAPPEVVAAAKAVIHGMRVPAPSSVPNPRLQYHYRALEALALNTEVDESSVQNIEPDANNLKKIANELSAFEDSLASFGGESGAGGAGSKRKGAAGSSRGRGAGGSAAGSGSKRAKTGAGAGPAPGGDDDDEEEKIDFIAKHAAGELKKLTIPQLKIYLKANRLPQSGKKDDLIQRISDHIEKKAKKK